MNRSASFSSVCRYPCGNQKLEGFHMDKDTRMVSRPPQDTRLMASYKSQLRPLLA